MMQTTSKTVDFFLGATTPAGFKGYFEPPAAGARDADVSHQKRARLRQIHPDEAAGPKGRAAGPVH